MMVLIYNGVNITPRVEIADAGIIDGAGGQLDSIEIAFADTGGQWSQWAPARGDRLRLLHNGFDSGDCYIDYIGQQRGLYRLGALSAPVESKERHCRSWQKVTLLQMAADRAGPYGFKVFCRGITDYTYQWVDQSNKTDFEFIHSRCRLEGYTLKINNGMTVIYSEREMEQAAPARLIRSTDFCGTPDYRQSGPECGSVTVSYGNVFGTFSVPDGAGPVLVISDVPVHSIAEAQRFAAGIARDKNRMAEVIVGTVLLDMTLAGGSMVGITGLGTGDGLYMVDEVEHHIVGGTSDLRLRKRLEGY